MRRHPVGFFADEKSNRSYAGWNHPSFPGRRVIERGRMRRQSPPAYCAGEAKLVQPLGIVVCNTPAQDLSFPGIRGNLKTLQLAQHIERGAFALDLRIPELHAASATASA